MPRIARDSDEEVDAKTGSKTSGTNGPAFTDSHLRRSTRIHHVLKHNDSLPESPLNDTSNTQTTRVTRRRAGTMDTSENHRATHTRKNSVSSDVSENTEVHAPGTPGRRSLRTAAISPTEALNKTNSRASKRLTRAGSEAKSPPTATRITRRTRASSMEPEAIAENKILEKSRSELVSTPVKTRRRTSMIPTEATVIEEREEFMKIAVVALDRTLPNLKEGDETGSDSLSKLVQTRKLLTPSRGELNTSRKSINKKDIEDNVSVQEAQNITTENLPSNNSESVETDASIDNKIQSKSDKDILEKDENVITDTGIETESLIPVSQVLSQNVSQDTTQEIEIKIKNVFSLKEQDEALSDKENETANIISESKNTDDTVSNALLQSPKPLPGGHLNANKLIEQKCKSSKIEANLTIKRRDSTELSEVTGDSAVSIEKAIDNSNTANDSTLTNVDTLANEEDADSSDNMQKLVVSIEAESLNETAQSDNLDTSAMSIEVCTTSSIFNEHSEPQECTPNVNEIEIKNMEMDEKTQKTKEGTCSDNEASNEDENIQMNISNSTVEETANKNEKAEKDSTDHAMDTDDTSEVKEEIRKLKQDETNLSSVAQSKSPDMTLLANTQSSVIVENETTTNAPKDIQNTTNVVSENETTTNASEDTENMNNVILENEKSTNVAEVAKSTNNVALENETTTNASEDTESTNNVILENETTTNVAEVAKSTNNVTLENETITNASEDTESTNNAILKNETTTNVAEVAESTNNVTLENETITNASEDTESTNNAILKNETTTNVAEVAESTNNVSLEKETATNASEDTESTNNAILEKETTANVSKDIENTGNLSTQAGSELDAHTSLKDLTSAHKNEDNVANEVKNSKSCTVTETPAEPTEEIPEKGEQLENTSVLIDSLTSKHKSDSELMSKSEEKVETGAETRKGSEENMEVDDNESDTNAEYLFQDIPADEWKEKNSDDKNSVHSMSTERLDNESEAECDLVLVDKEAWLAAENMKVGKEKEDFDYDSDDTVVLKTRRVCSKRSVGKVKDTSEDESKENVSKTNVMNTSNRRKSIRQVQTEDEESVAKDTEDTEITENATEDAEEVTDKSNVEKNESVLKETNERSTPKSNVSTRESVGRKSLSEVKAEVVEDLNKLSTDSPLNKSTSTKKGKAANKSIQKMNNTLETSTKTESAKTRKSLNKSKSKESYVDESESNDENVAVTSAKKNGKQRSLNSSSKKNIKAKQLDENSMEESDNKHDESTANKRNNSAKKKKLTKNYSAPRVVSDSDVSKSDSDSDSDDPRNKSVKLPKFLFAGVSSNDSDADENESDKSIDSDIEREYNLHGKSISKYSDDDVPGDVCRASETESSDPDDGGSDLADFVVDDDEVEESGDDEEENEQEDEEINITGQSDNEDDEEDQKADGETLDKPDEEVEEKELKEQQSEGEESVTDVKNKENINNSLNSSKKGKKSKEPIDSSLPQMNESGKKKKKKSMDTSQIEKSGMEHTLSDVSLSNSLKMKKTKQKRPSGEFIAEGIENGQSLNESQLIFTKKANKLSKSMECSTPKMSTSKWEKFNISLHASNLSLESTHNKLTSETSKVKENICLKEEKIKTTLLKKDNSLKKLQKAKSKENLMHKTHSPESTELIERTNVSKLTSKQTDLDMTTPVSNSDTPTTKYLRKEKLNVSAPVVKLRNEFKKVINNSMNDMEINRCQSTEENANVQEPNEEVTEERNASLKKKLLKVADNILETDKKKRKKRKRPTVEGTTPTLFDQDNFLENTEATITKKKQKIVDKNEEEKIVPEKKKKKKMKVTSTDVEEITKQESYECIIETRSESTDDTTQNRRKYKQKKETRTEIITQYTDTDTDTKSQTFGKKKLKGKKKTVSLNDDTLGEKSPKKKKQLSKNNLQGEGISTEKVRKNKKLSSSNAESQDEISTGKLSKKKQKLLSKNVLEDAETSTDKVLKKKKKLSSKGVSQDVTTTEKLSKKKQKLLSENGSKNKVASKKLQQSNSTSSETSERPEVDAFSKALDEALEVIKRTADDIKPTKEVTTKKRKIKENKGETEKRSIKRLPDEILENLSDIPLKPLKKRKLSTVEDMILPSRSMFNSNVEKARNVRVNENFIKLSSCGGTTQFGVVNLEKMKKPKKVSKVASFKQKMLSRNARNPMSAYLMYLEKQKVSGKDKFCNKPY